MRVLATNLPRPQARHALAERIADAIMNPIFLPLSFSLFIGIRAALIAFVPVEPTSDFLWYHNRALAILRGEGYSEGGVPTAYWPVGWPAAAALFYKIFGADQYVLKIANLIFAAGTFFLTLALGRVLFGSEMTARLSTMLLALYPNNIAYATLTSTEVFYTFLLLLGTWLFITRRRLPWLIVCGLVFGYATLTKPQTLLMPAILVGISFLFEPGRRLSARPLAHGAVVYLAMAIVLAPWIYRNHQVFGEPVFVSTNSGWALFVGNNPSSLAYRGFPTDDGPEVLALRKEVFTVENQLEANKIARQAGVDWIRQNPGTFALLMPIKAFSLWSVDGEAEWAFQLGTPWYDDAVYAFRAVRALNQAYYGALMLGAAAAALLLVRRWYRSRTMGDVPVWALVGYAFAAYTTLQCMIMAGSYRYKFPLLPFVIMACAWAVTMWLQRTTESTREATPHRDHESN